MVQLAEFHDGLPPHLVAMLRRLAAKHELMAALGPDEDRKGHASTADSCRNLLEIFRPVTERRDRSGRGPLMTHAPTLTG